MLTLNARQRELATSLATALWASLERHRWMYEEKKRIREKKVESNKHFMVSSIYPSSLLLVWRRQTHYALANLLVGAWGSGSARLVYCVV